MKLNSGEFCIRVTQEDAWKIISEVSSNAACAVPFGGCRVTVLVDEGTWLIIVGPVKYRISAGLGLQLVGNINKKIAPPPWGDDWLDQNDTPFDGNVGGKVETDPSAFDEQMWSSSFTTRVYGPPPDNRKRAS